MHLEDTFSAKKQNNRENCKNPVRRSYKAFQTMSKLGFWPIDEFG